MEILITGGAGAIGSSQAEYFINKGHKVRVLDDFSTGNIRNLISARDKISIFRGSIADRAILKKALSDVDVVLHNAAFLGVKRVIENPWKVLEINNYHNHIFLEEVLKYPVDKLLFASSSEVYGDKEVVPIVEDGHIEGNVTDYGITKLLSERYCKLIHELYGLDTCSFRYFNIYGPNQQSTSYGFVVGIFLQRAFENKPLIVYGDGEQTRDFTYIEDACDAVNNALKRRTRGESFNVGTGIETKIKDLASLVCRVSGKNLEIKFEHPRSYDQKRRLADINKIKKYLDWQPKTSIEEGIKKTWEWMKDVNRKNRK